MVLSALYLASATFFITASTIEPSQLQMKTIPIHENKAGLSM